jgi:hypothetical protein
MLSKSASAYSFKFLIDNFGGEFMINMKNSAAAVAVALLGLGIAGMGSAQAATCATAGVCFEFINGGTTDGSSAPTGSWFSVQTSMNPDTFLYTAMRGAGTTIAPATNGFLNFSEINTLGVGTGVGTGPIDPVTGLRGAPFHNSGNMIDRDWSFFSAWGAHYTNQVLEVTGTGNTRNVDMTGWTMGWNGISIDLGAGGSAVINNNDSIWGNGNDTLDYAVVMSSEPFNGVPYAFHMVGSYNPVPLPAAVWLLGSGLIGLVGVARRRKALVD